MIYWIYAKVAEGVCTFPHGFEVYSIMNTGFSPAQQKLYREGAFTNHIDPFAEAARYFHPLHNSMIDALLEQLQVPLMTKGYVAGRETSLQIAEGREPDIYVRREDNPAISLPRWNYKLAAEEILAEVGVKVEDAPALDALHIRDTQSGNLVTVLEIVSPGNKTRDYEILAYRERRSRLLLEQGVNVAEIDLTRSVKRLTQNSVTTSCLYHVALYVPGDGVHVIEIGYGAKLPRIALPLRLDVIGVELQDAYSLAYGRTMTAWQIQHEQHYTADHIPFPTTFSDEQIKSIMKTGQAWQAELQRLAEI
jgi:hypothetical protein